MTVTDFIRHYNPIKVNQDDKETGDLRLDCPEEQDRAAAYHKDGYRIASVYEELDDVTNQLREEVYCDNDPGRAYHKIGYFVYHDQRLQTG
jgi:hypothetical protein